jgi:hypothetical protein
LLTKPAPTIVLTTVATAITIDRVDARKNDTHFVLTEVENS